MTVAAPFGAGIGLGLESLLRSMADDEFVIGFSDSEWTGIAPILEEDIAMSSLAQDELGHAAALYGLLADLTGGDADRLAYDRQPAEYRHARLLDHGRGDWAMTIARRFVYETADAVRLRAWSAAGRAPLAELVGKLVREERYHRMHVETWLARLAGAGGESRVRLRTALETLAPDAATVFTPLPGEPALVEAGSWPCPCGSSRPAGGPRSRRRFAASTCPSRIPVRRRPTVARATGLRSTGCGASSPWSATASPGRPGERGRHPRRRRADAGRRHQGSRVGRGAGGGQRPSSPRSERSWTRSCRWSRSSISG